MGTGLHHAALEVLQQWAHVIDPFPGGGYIDLGFDISTGKKQQTEML